MSKYLVLYNPKAGNGTGRESAKRIREYLEADSYEMMDITSIVSYDELFSDIGPECIIIICGGDGTINRFINNIEGRLPENEIMYYATGSGNDFLHDLGKERGSAPVSIREYLKNLPTVTVKGKEYFFVNGVGFGIDGYCCEEGDRLKSISDKPVNYTSIAIKGLLFKYEPTNAVITVDGEKYEFKKVWLAPTMNGRFYGGGMMPAPAQDRKENGTVSTLVMFGKGKLATLIIFPSIFKGEHIKHSKSVRVLTGKEIEVEFDSPRALQIDGETILDVKSYKVRAFQQL